MATSNQSGRRDSLIPAGWQQRQEPSPADDKSSARGPALGILDLPISHGYEIVKDPSKQIRLCRILATTETSKLALERITVYLSDVRGQFVALSYTWAGMELEEDVWVNGIRIKITRNLHTQLCRLRDLGCDAMLWIDILSIHQSDEVEKSAQVALMSEIFRGPKIVYVGLIDSMEGVEQDKVDHALIGDAVSELADGKHFCDLSWFSEQMTSVVSAEAVERLLYRVLDAHYWGRVWVLQEVVLAPACDILLASGFVSWRSLADAVERLNTCRQADCCSAFFGLRDARLQKTIHKVYTHMAALKYIQEALPRGVNILEVIQCFQYLDASDPRDKINGFRGLHTENTQLPHPTYEDHSTSQFFQDMGVWLLENTKGLVTFALDLVDSSMELPSWTPGFSSKSHPIEANYYRKRMQLYMAYDCGLDLQQLGTGRGFSFQRPGQLTMDGIQIDEIVSVAADKLTFLDAADHMRLMKKWFVFATGREPLANVRDPFDDFEFCDAMLGGHVQNPTHASGWRKATPSDHSQWQHALLESEHGPLKDPLHKLLLISHVTATLERRLFKTKGGSLAIAPANVQPGDVVWVFKNGKAPFVIRKATGTGVSRECHDMSKQQYKLQGHCYHHRLMQGEYDIAEALNGQRECLLV